MASELGGEAICATVGLFLVVVFFLRHFVVEPARAHGEVGCLGLFVFTQIHVAIVVGEQRCLFGLVGFHHQFLIAAAERIGLLVVVIEVPPIPRLAVLGLGAEGGEQVHALVGPEETYQAHRHLCSDWEAHVEDVDEEDRAAGPEHEVGGEDEGFLEPDHEHVVCPEDAERGEDDQEQRDLRAVAKRAEATVADRRVQVEPHHVDLLHVLVDRVASSEGRCIVGSERQSDDW